MLSQSLLGWGDTRGNHRGQRFPAFTRPGRRFRCKCRSGRWFDNALAVPKIGMKPSFCATILLLSGYNQKTAQAQQACAAVTITIAVTIPAHRVPRLPAFTSFMEEYFFGPRGPLPAV